MVVGTVVVPDVTGAHLAVAEQLMVVSGLALVHVVGTVGAVVDPVVVEPVVVVPLGAPEGEGEGLAPAEVVPVVLAVVVVWVLPVVPVVVLPLRQATQSGHSDAVSHE